MKLAWKCLALLLLLVCGCATIPPDDYRMIRPDSSWVDSTHVKPKQRSRTKVTDLLDRMTKWGCSLLPRFGDGP